MSETSKKLFENYAETHTGFLDSNDQKEQARTNVRAKLNYPQLLPPNRGSSILEIGCNKGYFLKWLTDSGYSNVVGVDLSPTDLNHAKRYTGLPNLFCEDGLDYLARTNSKFDVIIFRAVFEHIEKDKAESFLRSVGRHLTPDGSVFIEVPNMDWFLAGHERYMDFTHEIGYTRESLGQLTRLLFGQVSLHAVKEGHTSFPGLIRVKILKPIVQGFLQAVFSIMGEGAGDMLWAHRAIIAKASIYRGD